MRSSACVLTASPPVRIDESLTTMVSGSRWQPYVKYRASFASISGKSS